MISDSISRMGYSWDEYQWGSTTTHEKTVSSKSKMPDGCLYSPSRRPGYGAPCPWPSLVLETGVSESLPRLHKDAEWWFANSDGDVRVVLILSTSKATRKVVLERWQLAPIGTPIPLSPETVSKLQQENTQPPMEKQTIVSPESALCAQRMEISRATDTVTGGPLHLPFLPIMDIDTPREGDTSLFYFSDDKLLRC